MARTTRSKAGAGGGATPTAPKTSRYVLPSESVNPPKVFILPKKATGEARIASLLNPRYAKPARYLVCPETGIYEFTKVAAPKTTPRSWLIECGATGRLAGKTDKDGAELGAHVTKGADLFIATPIDPLFLILPALAAASKSERRFFLSSDDHFDSILHRSPHLAEVLRWGNVRRVLESRMAAACETSQGGDELMFRLSEEKLLDELVSKAKRMADQPLPKSMEEKFVAKVLEAPMLGVKREATLSVSQSQGESALAPESETTPSTVPSTTEVMAAALQASEEVTKLQRLRTAFQFICSRYVAPAQAAELKTMLEERKSSLADFAPLDDYLARIAKMRQDALAARSMGDYSRKRVVDDEEAAERAEKKRKKEEEDKRKKAGQSRGVRDLQKVNTRGMKKMSDFFKKK